MIFLSPKQKLYLTSCLFPLAIILIGALVIVPLADKIKSASAALIGQKTISDNFYQNWKDLENAKKTHGQIMEDLKNQPGFLTEDNALKFIMAVENIALITGNSQGIFIDNNTGDKKPASNEEDNFLKLRVSLSGSFPSLLKFLIRVENSFYLNDITSLQINRITDKKDPSYVKGRINSVINISARYQQ